MTHVKLRSEAELLAAIDYQYHLFKHQAPVCEPIQSSRDETEWRCQFPLYLEGYYTVMPPESLDLEAFSKQIQMKCLEIYLWTKNNWDDAEAPGGGDNRQWLQRIYEKIVDSKWSNQLLECLIHSQD